MSDAGKFKTFSLQTPADYLQKLRWEVTEIDFTVPHAVDLIAYRALNCAATAWHMCDWIAEACTIDTELRTHIETLIGKHMSLGNLQTWARNERSIAICRQLATAAKHFVVKDYPDGNVKATVESQVTHSNAGGGDLWVRLTIEDGNDVWRPHQVFWQAYQFWNMALGKHGMPGHEDDA